MLVFSLLVVEEADLFERDTDPFFFPPHNAAWHAVSIRSQKQDKVLGDSNWVYYVQHRPVIRHIVGHADDRAAVELNLSGLQNLMTNCATPIHRCSSEEH
jgi:hypothetical protein